jgi:hypothetical protein
MRAAPTPMPATISFPALIATPPDKVITLGVDE